MKEQVGLNKFSTLFVLFLFSFGVTLFSQERKQDSDSLVRLIEAKTAQLVQENDISYRKIVGPARFLHNDTFLLCDTAIWNVNSNVINAIGNVQVIQENTFLTGDRIEYIIDENLAKVRGNLVELFDKEGNILRTNFLDYNTKDSIGTFFYGGAMRNSDGNLIESDNGIYSSADKLFKFINDVNMFTDSVFVKSDEVDYRTDLNIAYFGNNTTAWQEGNILRANSGEFIRGENIFNFNKDAYILTQDQELWADILKFNRNTNKADLYNNIQLTDTVQNIIALGDRAEYISNPMYTKLTEDPAILMCSDEDGIKDTLYIKGDQFIYYSKMMSEIDSATIALSKERLELALSDPLKEADKKATQAANLDKQAPLNTPDKSTSLDSSSTSGLDTLNLPAQIDSLTIQADSLSLALQIDTLTVQTDTLSLAPQVDTTSVVFMDGYHNIKFFRSDAQGKCDSLVYTSLDSIARFYIEPVMWNEGKNQFTSDSMQVVIKNNVLNKANLLSNAFIVTQEDSIYFNQIKSPEMSAFFNNGELVRFDALGGVSAIFYLQEDSLITEMNQKDSKSLTVTIKDKKIQRLKYIDQIKNNAFPVFGLAKDKQQLRGFNWRGDERPLSRYEITDREIRKSLRKETYNIEIPLYNFTGVYFPQMRDTIIQYREEVLSSRPEKDDISNTSVIEDTNNDNIDAIKLDNEIIADDKKLKDLSNLSSVIE